MRTAIRFRVAFALLLLAVFGLTVFAVVRQRRDAAERLVEGWRADELYDRIAVGDTDTRVDDLAEFKGEVIREPGWPTVIGELDGCENGCDVGLTFHGPPHLRLRFGPREKITWVGWVFPRSGRWVAVAVVGEYYLRGVRPAVIVAKRKNF